MACKNTNDKEALLRIRSVVETLTGPNGCPWDREQTPESLADYIIEESHELASAIRSGSAEDVCEELGDLSFLLIFLASLYEKSGKFTLAEALENNSDKMIRRHPHVYENVSFPDRDSQLRAWEAIKRSEHAKGDPKQAGVFDSLPRSLPALIKGYRINSKAARLGFTWQEDEEVEQQVESEWLELLDAKATADQDAKKHELGDLIFSIIEYGRRLGIKANEALELANMRFLDRFARMEHLACANGQDISELSLDEMDELWNKAKKEQSQHIKEQSDDQRQ